MSSLAKLLSFLLVGVMLALPAATVSTRDTAPVRSVGSAAWASAIQADDDPDPFVLLPPSGLVGHYSAATDTVSLQWEPPLGDTNPGRTYNVYRNGALLNTSVDALAFVDETVPDGLALFYQVTAVYSHGPLGGARASTADTQLAVWESAPATCSLVHLGPNPQVDWDCIGV